MFNRRLLFAAILGLVVASTGFYGCSSKKKIVAQPKQTVKAPEAKSAPAPQVKEAPKIEEKKLEEQLVPRDLRFATVYFDFDESNIRDDQRSILINNAQLLSRYKTVKVKVEGHCDERGTNEYNLALGERRADAVKSFLIDYGIDGSRISTVTYGEERPVDPGHDETAWAKNRRSEFIVTSKKVSIAE